MTIQKFLSFKLTKKIRSNIFEILAENEHEQLIFGYDKKSGLKAIIAIHSTILGPSTGGTRMEKVSETKAIEEALRLSYAMTFKNAIIDEPFGGSKAVIIGDPNKDKTKKLLYAFGDFIQSLKGNFLTGVDMGLSLYDAKIIAEKTDYIFNSRGCSGITTGYGVYKGIKECAKKVFGSENLKNKIIAVQGLGYVGETVVKLLTKEKAKIFGADTDQKTVLKIQKKYNITIVSPQKIYEIPCDIFSPCAIGGIINDQTIPKLKCRLIAGGANNQLQDENKHSLALQKRKILHAPDFVINAGGVCHGMCEVKGVSLKIAMEKTNLIPKILKQVFELAEKTGQPPIQIAYQIAYEKLQKAKTTKKYNR